MCKSGFCLLLFMSLSHQHDQLTQHKRMCSVYFIHDTKSSSCFIEEGQDKIPRAWKKTEPIFSDNNLSNQSSLSSY